MSVITIFSGLFCKENDVLQDIAESTGYPVISDHQIIETASRLSGIAAGKIKKAFSPWSSVFNQFTHEKECSIAYLRLAVANAMMDENIILSGYNTLLIPADISHVLRICLIANHAFRLDAANQEKDLAKEEAVQAISAEDLKQSAWTDTLFSIKDPWDPSLYDMVLPMEQTDPVKASAMIKENLLKQPLRETNHSKTAAKDFALAAAVGVELAKAGHDVDVKSDNGSISIIITRKVLMLNRLEEELSAITRKIPGVESVKTLVKPDDQPTAVYRKFSSDTPSKVLLVDDEREFVQTLSERLQMRDMGCAVAFDGASALELVRNDDPEVIIIDLKMPGLDGMAVLKQVKQIRPEIEVIILTGHGSEKDRQACLDMGAFSYLQKPADINILSQLLKDAHKKIKTGNQISV